MNYKLILNILSNMNGGLIAGAALFNPLIGQDLALKLVAGLGICQIIIASIQSAVTNQANTIREVASMPGVERIAVNAQANPTLAAVATDSAQPKVGPADPTLRATLQSIAKS